jgi:hypothetical protein
MTARVTQAGLVVAYAGDAPARVTQTGLVVALGRETNSRITQHGMLVALGRSTPVRVTQHSFIIAQSVHRAFYLNRLDGGEIFNGFKFVVESASAKIPEFNPYRPTISQDFSALPANVETFLGGQTATLRQQHDLIQAGDTTFPWQILTQNQSPGNKLFNLGSIGRFYHEEFGIILARYVQYKNLSIGVKLASPMGALKDINSTPWQVTDRLDLSSNEMPIGFLASYDIPVENGYGWVIVNGFMLVSAPSSDLVALNHGTPFMWESTGKISSTAGGRILGRLQGDHKIATIRPGEFRVEIESWSQSDILGWLSDDFQGIRDELDALEAAIASLTAAGGSGATAIALINSKIEALNDALAQEQARRLAGDESLSNRINAIDSPTRAEFNDAVNALTIEISDSIAVVQAGVNDALNAIAAVNARIDNLPAVDLSPINDEINTLQQEDINLQSQIDAISGHGPFPVVDGSVPPNLVYLDDGTLVYTIL